MKKGIKHVWAITAHGESPYLEECICSIKGQTVQSEIIICTATDNEFIQALGKKYNIPVHVKTGKDDVRENWNFAYNAAEGDWITLAHQDDLYDSNYVEELEKRVISYKNAAIFFTDYEPFGGNNKGAIRNRNVRKIIRLPLKVKPLAYSKFIKCMILSIGNAICCPTVSFHKEFLGEDIFIKWNHSDISANLDWEMWILLAKQKNSFVYCSKKLLHYRLHEGQETAAYMNNHKRYMEDYSCFRLIWPKPICRLLMKMYIKAYNIY